LTSKLDKLASYTAASAVPLKVLLDQDLLESMALGKIIPVHPQLVITNRCNLNCHFCSCADRDKGLELSLDEVTSVLDDLRRLGAKAITITGGGEPLLHPHFNEIIHHCRNIGLKVGLVTNGLLLRKFTKKTLDILTWCRISSEDDRLFSDAYSESLKKVVRGSPGVGWAFSHVTTSKPSFEVIGKIVDFSNRNNLTHVRLVSDLFQVEGTDLESVKAYLTEHKIDDKLVIYQGRKDFTVGSDCLIGFLKPTIYPDHKVYVCCGAQYALSESSRDMPRELALGTIETLNELYSGPVRVFDGSVCSKCYYSSYNTLLSTLLKGIEHKEFV